MFITVKGFDAGGKIPKENTCDGFDLSPEAAWGGLPENTESLALIMEDPDASVKTAEKPLFCHWVIYDIPPTLEGLPRDFHKLADAGEGIKQGKNDFGNPGYGGPCPRTGEHRYFFRLFALDCILDIDPAATGWKEIYGAMKGHVIDNAEYMGRYQRQK